jgi:Kazal-type serine protease inhibitor domain
MVRNAIVKLCTLLVLVLLVGVAASGWAADANKAGSSTYSKAKGAMCGGIAGLKCPEGQACRYPTNMCNVADLSGTCIKVPANCPKGGAKVCGCDGKTYANQCELLKAGVHEASKGACKKAA